MKDLKSQNLKPALISARIPTLIFFVILLLGAVIRLSVISHPMSFLDENQLTDDGYISLQIAKHIGTGQGPRYGDHYTNGFQPLYVFLASPIYRHMTKSQLTNTVDLDSAVKKAITMVSVFDLASIVLIGLLLARRFRWTIATFFGMALWALHPLFTYMSTNGLETSIALFFVLLSWYVFEFSVSSRVRWFYQIGLGVCLGLAVLSRIDAVFLGVIIFCFYVWQGIRKQFSWFEIIKNLIFILIGFSFIYLAWIFYIWYYTHSIFPISGAAVRQIVDDLTQNVTPTFFYYSLLRKGISSIYLSAPILWLISFLFLSFAGILRFKKGIQSSAHLFFKKLATFWFPFSFCIILFFAYTLFVPGWWYMPRYLFPWAIILIGILSSGIYVYQRHLKISIVVILMMATIINPFFLRLFLVSSNDQRGYRNLGLWAKKHFPTGTIVGARQTGALAYYATNLKVVNLDGVVNRDALIALKQDRIFDYMKDKKIQYVVGWKNNMDSLRAHMSDAQFENFKFIQVIPDFESHEYAWFVYKSDIVKQVLDTNTKESF